MSEPTPPDVMLSRTLRRAAQLRRRRRVAVGTLVAAVAALAVAIPVATLRSSGGSQVQVGSTPSAPPPTTASRRVPAACSAAQLTLSFDHAGDGALIGVRVGPYTTGTTLVAVNHSTRPCTVGGTPLVDATDDRSAASALPLPAHATSQALVLAPGGAAGSVLRWSDQGRGCVGPPATLEVQLLGVADEALTWQPTTVCGDPAITASPLRALAAPPSSDASPSASGLCTTAELELVYLPGGSSPSADPAVYSFEVVNVSGQSCRTGDYPGASVSDTSGSPLVVSTGRNDLGGRPTSFTLSPGGVASFALTLPNVPGAPCNPIGAFHFIAPDDTVPAAVTVAGAGLEECGGATGVSSVGPIHLGLAFALEQAAG